MNNFQIRLVKGILPFISKLDSFDKGFMMCMADTVRDTPDAPLGKEQNTTLNGINTKVIKLISCMPEGRPARQIGRKHSDSIRRSMRGPDNSILDIPEYDYDD